MNEPRTYKSGPRYLAGLAPPAVEKVRRNWRITFRIDQTEGEILGLDYEDYHPKEPKP